MWENKKKKGKREKPKENAEGNGWRILFVRYKYVYEYVEKTVVFCLLLTEESTRKFIHKNVNFHYY